MKVHGTKLRSWLANWYHFLLLSQLLSQSTPTVLHSTPFNSWQSAKWTPSFLKDKVSFVLSKKGQENVFRYYAVDQPLSTIKSITPAKPYQEIIYPGEHFFKILQEAFDGYYYYASGGIELLKLDTEICTKQSLDLVTFPSHEGFGQINFWFGKENVTAYTHYDTSHNLHALIYGKKKFLLFPPSSYSELGLHPCLHQFYRQVHADVLNKDVVGSLQTGPLEVILNPGEVLYIPPYWFHCVVTMETSISLNVWSNSESFLAMEDIFDIPIPFEEEWGTTKLLQALQYYIDQILRAVAVPEPSRFVRMKIFRRYEPLLAYLHHDKEDLKKLVFNIQKQCLKTPIEEVLNNNSMQRINDRSKEVAVLFTNIQPDSVRDINIGNFIEHLSWRILDSGDHDIVLLPLFLKECF